MKTGWEIQWWELRDVGEGQELFFVEATSSPKGWSFREQSTWETRWFPAKGSLRLILIANYLRQEILSGRTTNTPIVDLVLPHGNSSSKYTFWQKGIATLTGTTSKKQQRVVARFKLRGFAHNMVPAGDLV